MGALSSLALAFQQEAPLHTPPSQHLGQEVSNIGLPRLEEVEAQSGGAGI